MEINMHNSRRSAFTLIELLVVIGLIALLAGVLGLALGRGNSGAALQSSQATLQGLFAAARGQAALNQSTASIIVNTNVNSDGFLREFYIVVNGRAVGTPVTLAQGIFLVPRNTGTTYNNAVAFQGSWVNRVSSGFSNAVVNPVPTGLAGTFRVVTEFTNLGRVTAGGRIILAPAERTGAGSISFNNPSAVRGVSVSTYGVLTFLNDEQSML